MLRFLLKYISIIACLFFVLAEVPLANSAPCIPPPSGLVSWWRAEGNALDNVGGNNGMLSNGVSFAAGEVGQGFVLDGVNDYGRVPASPSLNIGLGGALTIETWINPAAVDGIRPIVEWNDGAQDGVQLWFGSGTGVLVANVRDAALNPHAFTSGPQIVAPNVLQHVALTYDKASGQGVIYLNGVIVAQASLGSFTPLTTADFWFGRRPTYGVLYAGLLDELSLYNRALGQSEIQAIYNAGSAGKCFAPVTPVITSQPTNQTVNVGGAAAFFVAAGGTPPLSYQWYFNATSPVAGGTNALLILTNVQIGQGGNYSVVVSNLVNSINSSNAVLTVNVPICVAPPSGLVSWWKGEGNGNDIIGGNTVTLSNGVSFAAGEVGQGFVLDGINDYGRVPASSSLNVGSGACLTIETWINPTAVDGFRPILEWNDGAQDGVQLWFGSGTGVLFANIRDTALNAHAFTSGPQVITSNVLQHVALTYDKASGQGVIYLNGVIVAQASLGSFTPLTTADLWLGRRPTESVFYAGLLDEVSLYNRALTQSEVQAIYNAGSAGKCFTPVAPVITSQPTNQTVNLGGTATFLVGASGTPPLSYQWYFNATTPVAGGTNALLTVTNVQHSHAGSYSVMVSNVVSSTPSSNAVLTVNRSEERRVGKECRSRWSPYH